MLSAAEQLQRWVAHKPNGDPQVPTEFAGHRATLDSFFVQIETLQNILGRNLEGVSFSDLRTLVASLASDRTTPYVLPKLTSIERELDALGASPLVGELRDSKPVPDKWTATFDFAWLASTLDAACEQDPEIRSFRGRTHSGFVEEFADLDEERIELAAARVRRVHGERAVAAMNAHHDQELLIRSEAVEWADQVDATGQSAARNGGAQHNGNGADHNTEGNALKANRGSNSRSPRPPVPQRSSITEYTSNELARLISWVTSDGQLRTDDEVLREMVEVLGFKRRGARIDLRLRQAIQQWRGRTGV